MIVQKTFIARHSGENVLYGKYNKFLVGICVPLNSKII